MTIDLEKVRHIYEVERNIRPRTMCMAMIPDLLEEIEQLRCEVEELEDDSLDEAQHDR